jgi:hypothetical protein
MKRGLKKSFLMDDINKVFKRRIFEKKYRFFCSLVLKIIQREVNLPVKMVAASVEKK